MCLSVFLVCEKKHTSCLCPCEYCHYRCRKVSLVVHLDTAVPTLQITGAYGTEQRVIPEGS